VKIHTFASETTDPATRGRQTGARWAREIRETAARYLDFFPRVGIGSDTARAIGEASLSRLDAWCPDLAAEVAATAEGAGLAPWRLACLNARTEILAVRPPVSEGECSTAVHVHAATDGPRAPRSIQTWDWHGMLAPESLLLRFATRRGVTVKLFTEFGMLGKIGVNSLGLGLHFNILRHASDNDTGGVPVHAIARRVLEEAASVEEAIDLARSATLSASTVLTVFTRDAAPASGLRAASIELSPGGVAVVPPREDGWVLHTNHFLDADLSRGERAPAASTTWARLAHLQAAVADMTADDLRGRAAEMCGGQGAAAPVCVHASPDLPDTERIETLLTIGIDTEACALDYAPGHPANLAAAGSARF
jgi:isopenicillin-N N-acyltransferase like protein